MWYYCTTLHQTFEKCWHKSSSLCLHNVYTNNKHQQLIREGILSSSVVTQDSITLFHTCAGGYCTRGANDEPCDFSSPSSETHTDAESEERSHKNIGHVFVHRPQQPIPNSWHITAQGYSKEGSADVDCSDLLSAIDLFYQDREITSKICWKWQVFIVCFCEMFQWHLDLNFDQTFED